MPIEDVHPAFPKTFITGRLGMDNKPFVEELDRLFSTDEFWSESDKFYKTKPYLHDDPIFKPLFDRLMEEIKFIMSDVYCYNTDAEPYFTVSWGIGCPKGKAVHRHYHPNSFLSGVYYPQKSNNYAGLVFASPHQSNIMINTYEKNIHNTSAYTINPSEGMYVIFPSDLEHQTEENQCEDLRYSIAFNVFLKGNLGTEESLTMLKL